MKELNGKFHKQTNCLEAQKQKKQFESVINLISECSFPHWHLDDRWFEFACKTHIFHSLGIYSAVWSKCRIWQYDIYL